MTITVIGANDAPVPVRTIPEQILPKSMSHTMDTAEYFRDPDGDTLNYEASSAEESVVTVKTSSSPVTMTAMAAGSTEVTVTATDPNDMSASQTFRVRVLRQTDQRQQVTQQGVTVSTGEVTVSEGATDARAYTVVLDTRPTGEVTVEPKSGDGAAVTVSPATLTFAPATWDTPQAVSVTGVPDEDAHDETVFVSHAVSGADYDGITATRVKVTVSDDERKLRGRVAEHWLARFGRTLATNAVDMISRRFESSTTETSLVTLGGHTLDLDALRKPDPHPEAEDLNEEGAPMGTARAEVDGWKAGSRGLTMRDFLLGSSFRLADNRIAENAGCDDELLVR